MPNFFTENQDLLFQFENINMKKIVDLIEDNYKEHEKYNYAPVDYADTLDNYRKVLEIVGDITGNFIAPRAADVDTEGARIENDTVYYAKGTEEALEQLSKAELMGMKLPRKYGGLNFPQTPFMMAVEMISRADASLMNIFGLQDIGETIHKYGTEEQKEDYLRKFTEESSTGAMVLTEPDAGSDLQAVKLTAYEDSKGDWRLRGVKRFITNGNGDVLLVLARSEAGTKDARGLSMFVCAADDSIKIRRIENKLGIHGSPTCEMQFNDTKAQLIGKRKFGLIKYVMQLMNAARLGVSAQALGISQAAYEEAVNYAKAREQFGKKIYNIPPVTNMLIDMRVTLETNRSLLYATSKYVDLRDQLEEEVNRLKKNDKSFADEIAEFKEASRIAGMLTPITKYTLTEGANKITYDSLQVHGGAGYMKDFPIERLVRDARITNIYEGTSQMQIVAAISGVSGNILADYFDKKAKKEYKGNLSVLNDHLIEIRDLFEESLKYVSGKNDKSFLDIASKELVELYTFLFVGYLVLEEAEIDRRKIFIANRYIVRAQAQAKMNAESIRNDLFSDILHADEILQ